MVLKTVAALLGELPADAVLPSRLRRCLDVSCAQQVLSVRVSIDDHEATQRGVRALEQELNAPMLTVLADASLPRDSLIVETERGVIDGSLPSQLRSLEQGVRTAIGALLDEYRYLDGEAVKQFDAIASGVRDVIALLAQPASSMLDREAR